MKVRLWCGCQHRPKHLNKGTYTVVTHRDSYLCLNKNEGA
jgi:hypothetical protein